MFYWIVLIHINSCQILEDIQFHEQYLVNQKIRYISTPWCLLMLFSVFSTLLSKYFLNINWNYCFHYISSTSGRTRFTNFSLLVAHSHLLQKEVFLVLHSLNYIVLLSAFLKVHELFVTVHTLKFCCNYWEKIIII